MFILFLFPCLLFFHFCSFQEECGVMTVKHQQNLPASAKQVLIDDIGKSFNFTSFRDYVWLLRELQQ